MNLWQKAIIALRRSVTLTDSAGWGVKPSMPGTSVVTQDTALALSAVWACTNLIAGTGASLPLTVYRTGKAGAREIARDHPLYYLLHDSPNADQTALDFWEFVFASIELRGDSFASIERIGARIVSLVPIRPDLVQVKRSVNGDLNYTWQDGRSPRSEPSSRMLHIRGFGGSPTGGLSTLAFARKTFGLAQDINDAAAVTFANGMRPGGALSFANWLTPDQRKIANEQLADKFIGSANSGRPMVLDGGTKWETFSINPEDAQMLESRGFSIEEICRFFGVPPVMIGHGDKTSSWGTGVAEVTQGFIKYTMRRRLKRIEQAISKQLLTPADRAAGVFVEFNLEGLLRGDSTARSAFYTAALQGGWMTVNEVRGLENLPGVDGGDVCRVQMQNVPLAEAIAAQPVKGAA